MDIRVFNFENPLGFRLAFTFKQNEYFFDTELTKDYFLKCEPSEDDNPLFFEGLLNSLKNDVINQFIHFYFRTRSHWMSRMQDSLEKRKKLDHKANQESSKSQDSH